MVLRIFKGTGPGVIFLISITLVAIWISAFVNPQIDLVSRYETDPMPLYGLLKLAFGNNAFAGMVFSFLLVSMLAFILVNFNTNVFFIGERTFLPALFYILFTGFFPQYQLMNPVLPASFFLMIAIIRIIDAYHNPGIAYSFFDAGILIGTGSLIYANLIWFALLVIIGIALIRTGNITEILISLLGLLTPYFLLFGVYYVMGKDLNELFSILNINLFGGSEHYHFPLLIIVALIFTGIAVFISIAYLVRRMGNKKIKSRKTFSLLIWVFIISLVIYFAVPSVSVEIVWLTSIPASYFLAHYFALIKKKLVPEIFFSLFFILVFLIQILYHH
jgi:hypothetical protein